MKVLREFHDINNLKKIYRVGDSFESEDEKRIENLIERGLIEGEPMPSIDSLTKIEIITELEERGIEFDKKAKVDELRALLKEGE
jgi:predicted transcriptional regulator YheO